MRLFKQPRVQLPTFMSIDDFEALMGSAASGIQMIEIMQSKVGEDWNKFPFSQLLSKLVPDFERRRPPEIEQRFKEITDGMCRKLFGRDTWQ